MFKKFKEKFKVFIDKYVQFVQRILVAVLLTLIYVIGFGITVLMIRIFRPSVLRHNRKEAVSYWQDARENDGLASSQRQS